MAQVMNILFLSSLLALATLHGSHAVEYTATNNAETTPGGIQFTNQIGLENSKQILMSATDFIWRTFQQNTDADRKSVERVSLFIDPETPEGVVAYAVNNEIHMGAKYLETGDVRRDFTGVMFHEMTHVWQWNGNGQAPGGLIDGIADFVRLRAGYVPAGWAQPGDGERWDEGYSVTARFLDYCNSLRNGFVAELNNKMRGGYSDNFFFELLGKTVDQLWSDYKAQYAS